MLLQKGDLIAHGPRAVVHIQLVRLHHKPGMAHGDEVEMMGLPVGSLGSTGQTQGSRGTKRVQGSTREEEQELERARACIEARTHGRSWPLKVTSGKRGQSRAPANIPGQFLCA